MRELKKNPIALNAGREDDRFIRAGARFLKAHGWNAIIGGPMTIEKLPGAFKYKYRLVMEFVGGKKRARKEATR